MNPKPPRLPPVPTPLPRLWREFRIVVLPWIVFVVMAAVVLALWRDVVLWQPVEVEAPDSPSTQGQADPRVSAARAERMDASWSPFPTNGSGAANSVKD